MSTASATIASFGIEIRVRRGLATISFLSLSGARVEDTLAVEGDSTGALLSAADDFLAAEGIDFDGEWAFIPGGGFRAMGYYA